MSRELERGVAAQRFSLRLADGDAVGWRWRNGGAPRLLFCHATGFCASAYKRMLALLAPNFDLWAVDLRGHGRATAQGDLRRIRTWDIYARDIAAFLDAVPAGEASWIVAGHSCGAVAATLAARRRADVAALALIEPVATPTVLALAARAPLWRRLSRRWPLVKGALSRRASWANREEARAGYAKKALFASWAEGALDDYLEDGLVETPSGVTLACDPRWEAATYQAQGHDFWGAVRESTARIQVLAARHPGSTVSKTAENRLRRLGAGLVRLEEAGHLLPMETPDAAARFIVAAAAI